MLWIDDLRKPPTDSEQYHYVWLRTVNETKAFIELTEREQWEQPIAFLDLDNDAGDYCAKGGDYIEILKWLEYRHRVNGGKVYPVHIHTMNPVAYVNMKDIIQYNGWEEII